MMRRVVLFLLMVLGLVSLLSAQTEKLSYFGLDGYRKTHPSYFRNFVFSETGNQLDTALLSQDVKNLWNTNLFSAVHYELFDTLGGTGARIVVREKWSAYPAGNGGIIDENFWVEVGWRDNHLIGRGIRAMLLARYYDRLAIRGFFQAPYWFGKGWGMESNWEFGRTFEPIEALPGEWVEFNQDRILVNAMVSYALQPNNLLYFGFEYEQLEFSERDASLLPPVFSPRRQQKIQLLVRHHTRYHLDILEQYLTGWSNEIVVKSAFIEDRIPGISSRLYPFLQNDFKLFLRPWKTGNIGARVRVGVAENDQSVFAQFIQDSFLNARGIGNKPYRGTAELTGNFELRQTIYDRHWIALQSVVFFDYSAVRPPAGTFNEMFQPGQSFQFAGIGGRIFFKNAFDFILRADYGIGLNNGRHGFVLGLGQYF